MSGQASSDPVAAEIQAKLTDHLATSAEQLQAQGISTDEARQQSQTKFGDPLTIGRRCYWIKQGDALMFRTAVIVLLSLLSLALGVAVFTSYRSQRQMADQMTALAEQLKVLADQQRAPAPTIAEPKPLEITGKVFIGSPDKPAPYHEIKICRAADGEVIRRFPTTADGSFASGSLSAGDYFISSTEAAKSPSVDVQTAPILLYPAQPAPPIDLDVSFPWGRLAIEFSRPLPTFDFGDARCNCRVVVKVLEPRLRAETWTSKSKAPTTWPIFIEHISHPNARDLAPYPWQWFFEILSNDSLENELQGTIFQRDEGRLPAGDCVVTAEVVVQPRPISETTSSTTSGKSTESKNDKSRSPLPSRPDRLVETFAWFGPSNLRQVNNSSSEDFRWAKTYFSRLHEELQKKSQPGNGWKPEYFHLHLQEYWRVDREGAAYVPITAGKATRIRIEIPDDLESRIQKAAEITIANPERGAEAWRDSLLLREAKITIVGEVPLTDP